MTPNIRRTSVAKQSAHYCQLLDMQLDNQNTSDPCTITGDDNESTWARRPTITIVHQLAVNSTVRLAKRHDIAPRAHLMLMISRDWAARRGKLATYSGSIDGCILMWSLIAYETNSIKTSAPSKCAATWRVLDVNPAVCATKLMS